MVSQTYFITDYTQLKRLQWIGCVCAFRFVSYVWTYTYTQICICLYAFMSLCTPQIKKNSNYLNVQKNATTRGKRITYSVFECSYLLWFMTESWIFFRFRLPTLNSTMKYPCLLNICTDFHPNANRDKWMSISTKSSHPFYIHTFTHWN